MAPNQSELVWEGSRRRDCFSCISCVAISVLVVAA